MISLNRKIAALVGRTAGWDDMARGWFEFRWALAAILLCGILKLTEREAPDAMLKDLQALGDDLMLPYERGADGTAPQERR